MLTPTRTWRRTAMLIGLIGFGGILAACAPSTPATPPATAAATQNPAGGATSSASARTVTATVHGTPVTFTLAPGQSAPADGSAPPDTLLVQGMSYRSGDNMSEAYSSGFDVSVDRPLTLAEAKREAERQLAAAPTTTP